MSERTQFNKFACQEGSPRLVSRAEQVDTGSRHRLHKHKATVSGPKIYGLIKGVLIRWIPNTAARSAASTAGKDTCCHLRAGAKASGHKAAG